MIPNEIKVVDEALSRRKQLLESEAARRLFCNPEEFFSFVEVHAGADSSQLRLKYAHASLPFPVALAITQIEVRKQNRGKLRSLLENPLFVVPSRLAAEQATTPALALYHAGLARGARRVLDMTCGLGVDAMAMAASGAEVLALERDAQKCACASWNAEVLDLPSLTVRCADSVEWIASEGGDSQYDVIFIDPARRDGVRRLYGLSDCEPDIVQLLPDLLRHADVVIIKASPMLDVEATCRALCHLRELQVVSVRGECKEVLAICQACWEGKPKVSAVIVSDVAEHISTFSLDFSGDADAVAFASDAELDGAQYLYEPDAAIMKVAPWREILRRFPLLRKVDANTHLFVSRDLVADFPGRVCKIQEKGTLHELGKKLRGARACAVSRNAPISAQALEKRLHLGGSDSDFIYCLRAGTRTLLFHCGLVNGAPIGRSIV